MTSNSSCQQLVLERQSSSRNSAPMLQQQGWYLTVHLPDADSVHAVNIDRSPFRIGRKKGLSLTLPSPVVSGEHAEILIEVDELLIRDLNSKNGTLKNGTRITSPTPLEEGDLLDVADVRLRVHRMLAPEAVSPASRALTQSEFDQFLHMRSVIPHYQPMISLQDGAIVGCEVFARSRVEGLKTPEEMFLAAARLKLEAELSRNLRLVGFEKSTKLGQAPRLFLNTHADELSTIGLFESLRKIREVNPDLPITLEIPEPLAHHTDAVQRFRETLKSLRMGLAYDHFGSGQTLRSHLAQVQPDYVKFDMNLIRDIHLAPTAQQALLANLVQMVHDVGVIPVAIGVESEFEHIVCREVGFELGQGFFYGKPAERMPTTVDRTTS